MRGSDERNEALFSYVNLEDRVPARHPLRLIRAVVNAALARLDDGTYGLCEVCGEPIADERLATVPAARFCVDHQADVET